VDAGANVSGCDQGCAKENALKYAVWIPGRKFFATKNDGSILLFDLQCDAIGYARYNTHDPCLQHSIVGCSARRCEPKVVPWDDQARAIANGCNP
jgi:hypothetical protein